MLDDIINIIAIGSQNYLAKISMVLKSFPSFVNTYIVEILN